MLRTLVVAALLAAFARATDYSLPGPHAAGFTTVTVARLNGSTFNARFVYPALTSGSGATYDGSGAPYPAVSFGHGFLQPPSAYQATLEHLATWGYFVIAGESQGGFLPSHQGLADDLRFSLDWLEQQNALPGSLYFAQVDPGAFGMSGHSMGGGASILAAAADPRVRALANLAAAETNPSAIGAIANVACPLALISGSQDSIVPVASNGQLMYAAANAPKLLPVIQGGYHCGFVDTPAFGGLGCDSGSLAKPAQLALAHRWLVQFFELNLRGDESTWPAVWGEPMKHDPAVATSFAPGFKFAPFAQRRPGSAGQQVVFDVVVQNTSNALESYTLFVEGLAFPYSLPATSIGPLVPGASISVPLSVTIPAGQAPGLERFSLSARRDADGATRAYALRGVRIL